jgi:hypothetical protein
VHPTLGILARFQAFFYALSFFQLDGFAVPAPARVTQTVRRLRKLSSKKMKSTISRKEYRLIAAWVLATSIGFVLSKAFLITQVQRVISVVFQQDNLGLSLFISEVTTGILVGIFQWLVIRTRLPHNLWWIFVTPLGMLLGSYTSRLFWVIENQFSLIDIWVVNFWLSRFLYGIIIGLIQWVVLRHSLHKSWLWVIVNGFGWLLAITIGLDVIHPRLYDFGILDFVDYFDNPYYEAVINGTIGAVVGIATGSLLLWLLRQKSSLLQTAA